MTDLQKVIDYFDQKGWDHYEEPALMEDEKKAGATTILRPDKAPSGRNAEVRMLNPKYYLFDDKGKFIGTWNGGVIDRRKLEDAFPEI